MKQTRPHRGGWGVPVQRDRVTLELFWIVFPCHRVGSSRFPQEHPGIERVQHMGSSPVFLGWTVIGWVVALVIAVRGLETPAPKPVLAAELRAPVPVG